MTQKTTALDVLRTERAVVQHRLKCLDIAIAVLQRGSERQPRVRRARRVISAAGRRRMAAAARRMWRVRKAKTKSRKPRKAPKKKAEGTAS